ncbi:MAG: hypothetical protein Q4G70_09420 [Pseudomonadota bacterium]|nr:hypothetical protein [Pseudomonadota bacterium]
MNMARHAWMRVVLTWAIKGGLLPCVKPAPIMKKRESVTDWLMPTELAASIV